MCCDWTQEPPLGRPCCGTSGARGRAARSRPSGTHSGDQRDEGQIPIDVVHVKTVRTRPLLKPLISKDSPRVFGPVSGVDGVPVLAHGFSKRRFYLASSFGRTHEEVTLCEAVLRMTDRHLRTYFPHALRVITVVARGADFFRDYRWFLYGRGRLLLGTSDHGFSDQHCHLCRRSRVQDLKVVFDCKASSRCTRSSSSIRASPFGHIHTPYLGRCAEGGC